MTGSAEFSTWAALAFSASFAGLCAIYTSSPLVLIAAALAGAYVGYKVERMIRRYFERSPSRKHFR
jgi:hypothetical protein